jgi:PAS domain S-box-containing protein
LGLRLIALIVLVVFFVGGLVGIVVIERSRSALRQEILDNNLDIVDLGAQFASSYLEAAQMSLHELARRPSIVRAVVDNVPERVEPEMRQFLQFNKNLDSASIYDSKGIGRASGLANWLNRGGSVADRDWFQHVMATGKPYLGVSVASRGTGHPIMPYGVPILDEKGAVRGALVGGISLATLSDAITAMRVSKSAQTSLIDFRQGGIILAHVNKDSILKPVSGQNEAVRRLMAGERGTMETRSSNGELDLAAFTPVPNLHLGILIMEPRDIAFAPVDMLTRPTLLLIGIAVLVTVIVGAWLALQVTRPLIHLKNVANELAAGDLTRRVNITRRDEIGQLGLAFDQMAESLQHREAERKYAEEVLRESKERSQSLIETSPDVIVLIDFSGKIIVINEAALTTYGYESRDELIGRSVLDFVIPEDRPRVFQEISKVLEVKTLRNLEYTSLKKDGSTFSIEMSASLILDAQQKPTSIVIMIRDITERKRVEEKTRRLATVVKDSNDAITIQDFEGRITAWNRGAELMYGFSEEEALQMNIGRLTSPDKEVEQKEFTRRLIAGEAITSLETQRVAKDGRILDIWMTVTKLVDDTGKPIGIASTERDITERKRVEQEMRTLEDQLRQSQKMEAIGQLAGGIAHDFNNLLTVIKGYSQLSLMELKEGDPLKPNIEEVQKAADRAAGLTRQLLAFSRRQVMEMRVLDPNTLLRDLDKMLRRIIGEDIELVTLLADDLGTVKADAGQIEQVVMNLAVNARDAMQKGGKLTIETANVELDENYARNHIAVKPGPYVMLSVSDTGVGMTPEVRDRVFEPFFTTKEKGKGTGLGLSTVYGIVKQSGGNIWVYSEPNHGTAFKIYLSRVDEPLEEVGEKGVKEGLPRGSETVLVVEDEEEVRKLAVQILRRQGYTVLEASQGNEASHICEQHKGPIHLMVMDVVMPGMTGRELAKSLEPHHPEMQVLYMSGYTDNAIVHHGILEKGLSFLQKPFTLEGLVRKVREVLDK